MNVRRERDHEVDIGGLQVVDDLRKSSTSTKMVAIARQR